MDYFRGNEEEVLDRALEQARVWLSPVVAAEPMIAKAPDRQRRQLLDFLRQLPVCDASLEQWLRAAELRSRLSMKGKAVAMVDAHVAQCALDLDGILLSRDRVFSEIAKAAPLRLG